MDDDEAIGTAMRRICTELPEGWSVTVALERGAGSVVLTNPGGEDFEFEDCGLPAALNAAVDKAQVA